MEAHATDQPTVLVAEDDAPIADLLVTLLETEGFRVLATGDGASAHVLALRACPDLLIADNLMPGLDGIALSQRLRRIYPGLPILLTSASPVRDVPAGVTFLSKPFNLDTLLTLVFRLVYQAPSPVEDREQDHSIPA